MGNRPRPLMTVFLVLGLIAVFSVPAIYATGQLPTLGGFDAAQTQYDDDDDGGNDNDDGGSSSSSDDDDDGGDSGDAGVAPPTVGSAGRNDCGTFARQNFNTPGKLAACGTATQQALSGQVSAAQACAGFSKTKRRRQKRSDYAACLASIVLSQAAIQP